MDEVYVDVNKIVDYVFTELIAMGKVCTREDIFEVFMLGTDYLEEIGMLVPMEEEDEE